MKKLLAVLIVSLYANTTIAGAIGDDQVDLDGNNNGTIRASNTTNNTTKNVTRTNNSTHDHSVASAGGAGGAGGQGGNATGGSVGDTTATGGNVGDTTATGGSVGDTVATVGDATSSSDNNNASEGGDVEFNYSNVDAENVASSAASVLTGYCQAGGSAQNKKGGFSLAGNDLFCDRIRMADYYWIQYERQVQLSVTFQCNNPVPALKARCAKTGQRMIASLDRAWENTELADELLDSGEWSAKAEKALGPFARIGGILGMVLLL